MRNKKTKKMTENFVELYKIKKIKMKNKIKKN